VTPSPLELFIFFLFFNSVADIYYMGGPLPWEKNPGSAPVCTILTLELPDAEDPCRKLFHGAGHASV
jgi:hypothetical protein